MDPKIEAGQIILPEEVSDTNGTDQNKTDSAEQQPTQYAEELTAKNEEKSIIEKLSETEAVRNNRKV